MAVEQAERSHGRVNTRSLLIGALVILVIAAAATLFGWDVSGWFKEVWNTIKTISIGYLIAGIVLITIQTTAAAFAWYSILRYAYPGQVRWIQVWACYAAAVALNFVLPANIGTLVMMLMFTTIIAAATFAGVVAGYVVQKVFFTTVGVATYLYLFLTVGGSFKLQFGFIEEHPWAFVILLAAVAVLIYLVAQVLRPRLAVWWDEAKEGGQIAAKPRRYFLLVAAPEAVSWLAMLGTIAVFLAAYNIPITFHTLMSVTGGNSLANMTSVTPGGAGVVQSFNALSLREVTSSSNAVAYSVAQQLVETAWSIALAIILLVRAFGWSGGRELLGQSYAQAKQKAAEETEERRARREARRAARRSQDTEDSRDPEDSRDAEGV
jgi:uncharacterized membrane protein YbhN (UPF0104 family)